MTNQRVIVTCISGQKTRIKTYAAYVDAKGYNPKFHALTIDLVSEGILVLAAYDYTDNDGMRLFKLGSIQEQPPFKGVEDSAKICTLLEQYLQPLYDNR